MKLKQVMKKVYCGVVVSWSIVIVALGQGVDDNNSDAIEKKYENGFKVVDATKNGCRIVPYNEYNQLDSRDDVFIIGFRGFSDRTYKGPLFLIDVGAFEYQTIMGNTRLIPKYITASDDQVALYKKQVALRNAERQRINDAIQAKKAQLAYENQIKTDKKIVSFLRIRIDAGSADAAWDLGQMYLLGKGVESDAHIAENLILLSATRGNIKAKQWIDRRVNELKNTP